MAKISLWIIVAMLAVLVSIVSNDRVNAQAAVPLRQSPAPQPGTVTVVIECDAVHAHKMITLDEAHCCERGANCPSGVALGAPNHWVMITGLNGGFKLTPDQDFSVPTTLTCTYVTATGLSGFLNGVSHVTGSADETFRSAKGDETCVMNAAWIARWGDSPPTDPNATELILW